LTQPEAQGPRATDRIGASPGRTPRRATTVPSDANTVARTGSGASTPAGAVSVSRTASSASRRVAGGGPWPGDGAAPYSTWTGTETTGRSMASSTVPPASATGFGP